jgi:serine/threonine-protein kinase
VTDFLAVALFFTCVILLLRYRHQRNMRELELKSGAAPALAQAQSELAASRTVRGELEQRIRNLESIVCSVDFELNAKLNRLASRQLRAQSPTVVAGSPDSAETEAFSIGTIKPGSRLAGRFVVDRLLGSGGMGAVFLARDEQLAEMVAVKIIAGAAMLDPAATDRFRREASAARRISHRNVVRIHDIGEEQGMLFLSMEYIEGTSLAALLQRHGSIPLVQLRDIVAQMCKGLEAAHAAGVIHRDLKPQNVLLAENGTVKIIDFGLAHLPHLEGMTATGMIIGTPEYMAPEQIRGRPVDARTDVYALGALVYHGLTGRPPFTGDSAIAVGFAHCNEALAPPHLVRPEVPEAWSSLVTRAMAKDPAARFDSVSDLAAALPPA